MLEITFGDDAARDRALDAIRAIHRRVHGTLPVACGRFPAGTPYSAEDPALLLWVHATLIESILMVYERLVGPLDEADRDRYCRDSADVAIALGAAEEDVPLSWPALREYLSHEYASGSIAVSTQARDVAAALLSPVRGFAGVPLTTLGTLVVAGLLPPGIRREYGFPWSRRRERLFEVSLGVLRATRGALPRRLVWWPQARGWAAAMSASRR
jgi:uncharacterized protein (DUF2236 family)